MTAIHAFTPDLLEWYDRHARRLPWRVPPNAGQVNEAPDPYRVWLSEIMAQQTTLKAVIPYFERFTALWPTVEALASASEDDVLREWAGLGYYSRARNLKKAADMVANDLTGRFPATRDALMKLPGVGRYTASAIASIAFGEPVAVVDGNVERVMARQTRLEEPVRQAKSLIEAQVQALVPEDRPGDFAQAMMDLGATICTPKNPACRLCPISRSCAAFASGEPTRYPVTVAKAAKPVRVGAAFVAFDGAGRLLLRRRPAKGLLAGMCEVPTTGWSARTDGATAVDAAPFAADWCDCGTIRHVFTHFELRLAVFATTRTLETPVDDGWWSGDWTTEAIPTVFAKAITLALESNEVRS